LYLNDQVAFSHGVFTLWIIRYRNSKNERIEVLSFLNVVPGEMVVESSALEP
jgi:hypothetical protein